MDDKILILGLDAGFTFAATPLGTVEGDGTPFYVARVGDIDHHVLFDNGVFQGDLCSLGNNLGPPGIAELLLHLQKLCFDNGENLRLGSENLLQATDKAQYFHKLVNDFFPLKSGQAMQSHLKNSLRLNIGKLGFVAVSGWSRDVKLLQPGRIGEFPLHQPLFSFCRGLG